MRSLPRRAAAPLRRFFDPRFAAVHARLDEAGARVDGVGARVDGVGARVDGVGARVGEIDGRVDALEQVVQEWIARQQRYVDESRAFQEDAADWLRAITESVRAAAGSEAVSAPPEDDPAVALLAAVAGARLAAAPGPVLVSGPAGPAGRVALALRAIGVAVVSTPPAGGGPLAGAVLFAMPAQGLGDVREALSDGGLLVLCGRATPAGDAGDLLDLGVAWHQVGAWGLAPTDPAGGWEPAPARDAALAVVAARPA